MTLKDKILSDLKNAMKEKDMQNMTLLRGIQSEIKNEQIKSGKELNDEDITKVISRLAKQRKDSIDQFKNGGREDLAENEKKELDILAKYLPEQMSDQDLENIIKETIKEVDAKTPQDMGKVMGKLMPKIQGKADGSKASELVKKLLN